MSTETDKKLVMLVFSDEFVTKFMQHVDIFQVGKALIRRPVAATVAADWGMEQIANIIMEAEKNKHFRLIAAVGKDTTYYVNPEIKVVSDGVQWMPIENYVESIKEKL